jgi:type VI secretion system secreted protein Hcp
VAIDYFLKIDGVPGESTDAQHRGEIEVISWSWGEAHPRPPAVGTGAGAGKVEMQDFGFTAAVSKASPPLLVACASGKHFRSAVLTARKAGGPPVEFMKFTLTDVTVSSYAVGGSEGQDAPMDSAALSFRTITVEYREQKPDGTLAPAIKAGWDVQTNTQL